MESIRFEGRRAGYVYTTRDGVTGYYIDGAGIEEERESKRLKRVDDKEINSVGINIDAMLARSETTEVIEIKDKYSAKLLLSNLEKKARANSRLRIKFSEEPLRFVESEIDLDEAIKEMRILSTAPELYADVVRNGLVKTLANLLEHDNADIRTSILNLLNELTDTEDISFQDEDALNGVRILAEAWLNEAPGIELIATVLSTLSFADEDEEQFHDALAIIEHLIDILNASAADAVASTHLPQILLTRIQSKDFNENKLYSSEILALLAQHSFLFCEKLAIPSTQDKDLEVGKKEKDLNTYLVDLSSGLGGMDAMLQACNVYRKRSPRDEAEEECVQNLFDVVATVLEQTPKSAVPALLEGEGIELMCRCAREGKHAAAGALKILDIALAVMSPLEMSPCAAEKFFECQGLRLIFRALLGKGAARPAKLDPNSIHFKAANSTSKKHRRMKRTPDETRATEEHVLGIITSLCFYAAENEVQQDSIKRLLAKLSEDDKLPRLFNLVHNYHTAVERERQKVSPLSELAAYARDLRAGGYALRLAATIIVFAAVHSPSCRNLILSQHIDFLPHVLANYAAELLEFDAEDERREENDDSSKDSVARREATRRATLLKNWAAAFAAAAAL